MIKRRIMLLSGAAVASFAIALSILALSRGVKFKDTQGTDETFTITFDADDVTTAGDFESKTVVAKTDQLDNPISFDFTNVKRNGDYFELKGSNDGSFGNASSSAIYAMRKVELFGKADNPATTILVKWGWKKGTVVSYPYGANIYTTNEDGGGGFYFDNDQPDYFQMINDDAGDASILIKKIVITYGSECKTETSHGDSYKAIDKIKYHRVIDHWEVMGFYDIYDTKANLTFESEIDGLPVKRIANYAFYMKGEVETVDFSGSNIEEIGAYSFYQCSGLTTVDFSGSDVTEIGSYAFYSCNNLSTITGLEQIEVFEDDCLDGCQITSITFGENLSEIGQTAFWGCDQLTSVTFSDLCEPTYISSGAFNMCNAIETVHIGSLMTTVPNFAHSYSLKEYSVGPDAVHFKVDEDGVLYSKNGASTYYLKRIPMGTTLTNYVMPDYVDEMLSNCAEDCVNLESVTINNEVHVIPSEAFRGCTSLQTVTFEAGSPVNYIYQHAFRGCTALTTIALPSTVRTISADVFNGCTGLTSFTLPSGLTSIYAAFAGCSNLATLNYDGTVEDWNTKVTYKVSEWYSGVSATVLTCIGGTIALADAD